MTLADARAAGKGRYVFGRDALVAVRDCRRGMSAFKASFLIKLSLRLDPADGVFYDDLHFNEKGARRVAEVLASELPP